MHYWTIVFFEGFWYLNMRILTYAKKNLALKIYNILQLLPQIYSTFWIVSDGILIYFLTTVTDIIHPVDKMIFWIKIQYLCQNYFCN